MSSAEMSPSRSVSKTDTASVKERDLELKSKKKIFFTKKTKNEFNILDSSSFIFSLADSRIKVTNSRQSIFPSPSMSSSFKNAKVIVLSRFVILSERQHRQPVTGLTNTNDKIKLTKACRIFS